MEQSNASQEEDRCTRQGAAAGRRGDSGSAGRYRPRSARREHHGVLQGVQRRRPRRMRGNVIPVEITIYEDRSFTFITKTPPAAELIKKAAGLAKGSGVPHKDKVGKLTKDQVREIADDQAPRPQRQRHRRRDEDRRGHRPLDGRHRRRLEPTGSPTVEPQHHNSGRAALRPTDHTWYRKRNQTCSAARPTAPRPRRSTRTSSTPRSTAIKLAKAGSKKKFDETVDVAMRLGVDPRKADQMVRGTVNLPHGTGKTARVLVFANGDKAEAAREAGADIVGGDELIEKVNGGWLDFDAVVATPGHDGQGRPPRPRARPPWPDAEPEDRHRHPRRGQGRLRHQGRQDRVPRRPARQPALHHRQGVVLRGRSSRRTTPPRSRRCCGSSRPAPRAATSRRSPSRRPWAPASRSTRTAPERRRRRRGLTRSPQPVEALATAPGRGPPSRLASTKTRSSTSCSRPGLGLEAGLVEALAELQVDAGRRRCGSSRCRAPPSAGTRSTLPQVVDQVVTGDDVVLVVEHQHGVGLVGQRGRAAKVADAHPLAAADALLVGGHHRQRPGRRGRGRGP